MKFSDPGTVWVESPNMVFGNHIQFLNAVLELATTAAAHILRTEIKCQICFDVNYSVAGFITTLNYANLYCVY